MDSLEVLVPDLVGRPAHVQGRGAELRTLEAANAKAGAYILHQRRQLESHQAELGRLTALLDGIAAIAFLGEDTPEDMQAIRDALFDAGFTPRLEAPHGDV